MKTKIIRNVAFQAHRVIGLIVGLVLVITGLTGSMLVFQREIVDAQTVAQFGRVVPQAEMVSPETIVNTVKTAYANQPHWKLTAILRKPQADAPYRVTLKSGEAQFTSVWVNPYTGEIMGKVLNNQTWVFLTFRLHYALLSGDNGEIVMGGIAGLLFVLCLTGIGLWSGWRKLIAGFRIKWDAHPKRVSFDVHNVSGILMAVFLAFTALTGFVWNLNLNPVVYALTGSPNPAPAKSTPIANQNPLILTNILQKADVALPGAETTQITFPQKPTDAYRIRKKFPQEDWHFGRSFVFLDQFSGEVLQVKDGRNPNLGDRVLASFTPLHYGTFWGLPSRILYVFVGLSPLVLFITGLVMWWHRKRNRPPTPAITHQSTSNVS
jgi:uncharacterized iron-regulated membrane protein